MPNGYFRDLTKSSISVSGRRVHEPPPLITFPFLLQRSLCTQSRRGQKLWNLHGHLWFPHGSRIVSGRHVLTQGRRPDSPRQWPTVSGGGCQGRGTRVSRFPRPGRCLPAPACPFRQWALMLTCRRRFCRLSSFSGTWLMAVCRQGQQ